VDRRASMRLIGGAVAGAALGGGAFGAGSTPRQARPNIIEALNPPDCESQARSLTNRSDEVQRAPVSKCTSAMFYWKTDLKDDSLIAHTLVYG
jgi:hypothetical protein